MRAVSHIRQPGVIPDARRRALRGVKPRFAAINTQSYTVNIRRYCHLKVRARFIGQIIAGDTAVVNQFNTVNGDMRVYCHRQRRGLLHISGPIFYLHRQDIVAVRPVAGRRKAPLSAGLNQWHLLFNAIVHYLHYHPADIGINIVEGKARRFNIGDIIARDAAVICAVQREGRHRQSGIDGEIERLCCLISRLIGRFYRQGIASVGHIIRPDIIPDARRRALGSVEPRLAAVNAQAHHVDIRRHRHLEVRTHVISQIIVGNTAVIDQFNVINGDLRVHRHRQRCRMAGVPRFIFD